MVQAGQQGQSQKLSEQSMQQSGQGIQFSERDMLQLVLNESKHTAETLNSFILETANEQLRRDYMTVLGEVYNQQKQVFDLMQQKGFYNVENASSQQISQAQSKFNSQMQ